MIGVASAFAILFVISVRAGLTVTQNISAGATSWPGTPLLTTVTNPAVQATTGETFTSGSGNTNHSQTFSIATNLILSRINIYAGGGSNGTMRLKLFDLGTGQTPPNPGSYTAGTDLFGSGAGLTFTYNTQANGVLQFDFTGADQVTLQAGHLYAFEVTGTLNTQPMYWYRAGSDTYSNGAAYRTRSWINGSNARDFALALYGTVTDGSSNATSSAQCTVNWNDVRQQIDGFGGGTVFLNPSTLSPVTDANMNTLFLATNANQLGLSLLRIRIDPAGSWANDLADAKKAIARGAGVLATPWTPPASMKDNGNTIHGSLLASQYTNYANYLNGFAVYMTTNGAPLRAISIQNEPDWDASYEGCLWTATQFQTFCHNVGGLITNAPLMMPESLNSSQTMSDATLNDSIAAANVDLVGGHLYGATDAGAPIVDYSLAHSKGKPTWMTEFLVNDQTWSTAIVTAQQIHDCLTIGNMSAYIWWKTLGDANGLVNASGVPQKRGFVMAQFSRFARPGYYRIGITNNSGPLQITAYKNLTNGNFAIIAINPTTNNIVQTFDLTGFSTTNITPWLTSAADSLAVQSSLPVSGASFTNTIPASSIVTLVGQALPTNSAPTNIVLSNSTLGENQSSGTAIGLLTTTDPDSGNTFTYTLVAGAGSTDNGSFTISGTSLLSAASFNYEVQNSFNIRIRSTDQGALFFEKNFTVTVTNVNEVPSLAVATNRTIGAGVVLSITNSASDPDAFTTFTYSLLTNPPNATLNSSNGIFTWRPLVSQANTTNAVSLKVSDNGSPVLSATNSFVITVSPLALPTLGSINIAGNQLLLSATGALGPDYTLLTSTNLETWQSLTITNPIGMPVILTDTNRGDAARFYRLQLGP